jgi:hypothetical protein
VGAVMSELSLEEQLFAQRIMDEQGYIVMASEVLHEIPAVQDGFTSSGGEEMLPSLRLFAAATREEYATQAKRYKLPYPVLDAPYFYKAIVE